jgi:hypothetical protein
MASPDGVEIGRYRGAEVARGFRKSSHSTVNDGDCVEVAELVSGARLVRDSKLGGRSPVLMVGAAGWGALVGRIRAGEL